MSDETDFAADPIAFMNKHVFVPMFPNPWETGGGAQTSQSGPLAVRVVPMEGARVMNPPQPGSKVFHMSLDVGGLAPNAVLDIYWLPYKADEFRWGVLTNQSRYMFTAAMNGCTLGIGSQTGDGTCLITHANSKAVGSSQGPAAQGTAQRGQVAGFFGGLGGYNLLEPQGYRRDTGGDLSWSACNFGTLNGPNWTFWTHKYRQRSDVPGSRDFFHGGPVTQAVPIPPI